MDVRLPPAINEVVENHTKWLRKRLYESRDRNGDIVFVFESNNDGNIDIPKPAHALNEQADVEMRDESG